MTDGLLAPALLLGGLGALYYSRRERNAGPSRTIAPGRPTIVEQSPPEDKDVLPANLAKPGEAALSEDRRRHILDGDGEGMGQAGALLARANFPPTGRMRR